MKSLPPEGGSPPDGTILREPDVDEIEDDPDAPVPAGGMDPPRGPIPPPPEVEETDVMPDVPVSGPGRAPGTGSTPGVEMGILEVGGPGDAALEDAPVAIEDGSLVSPLLHLQDKQRFAKAAEELYKQAAQAAQAAQG